MIECINGMWKFKGKGFPTSSRVYLRDDEIIGAIVDDGTLHDPKLILLTMHSGPIHINWAAHCNDILNYIEGPQGSGEDNNVFEGQNDNARETDQEF